MTDVVAPSRCCGSPLERIMDGWLDTLLDDVSSRRSGKKSPRGGDQRETESGERGNERNWGVKRRARSLCGEPSRRHKIEKRGTCVIRSNQNIFPAHGSREGTRTRMRVT